MQFPYTRIGGIRNYIPPYFSIVQINSVLFSDEKSRITRALIPSLTENVLTNTKVVVNIQSKVDSDWLGLIAGLEYALENGETAVALEHSSPYLIQSLIVPGTQFDHRNVYNYKQKLIRMAERIEWLGARLVPQRLNRSINQKLY
jgi:hypothetical protein